MTIAGKIWGTTECVLASPTCEIYRLQVKPFSYCSMHQHRRKWNAFYVVSGELVIEVEKNDYDLVDQTELKPGMSATVKPGEFHRFRTGARGCEALEIYYLDALSEDIERRSHGGSAA